LNKNQNVISKLFMVVIINPLLLSILPTPQHYPTQQLA